MTLVDDLYEPKVAPARALLDNDPGIKKIHVSDASEELLTLWLIHFSARGVEMTKPVDSWITRAGIRCAEIGLEDLGRALQAHAKAEAGHDQMMVADLQSLVAYWNTNAQVKLSVDELLGGDRLASTDEYIQLHEDTIVGPTPYGQVAIEYEIERMSTVLGPRMLEQLERHPQLAEGASFIREHVSLDIGHTAFNERQLEIVLTAYPEEVELIADAGSWALRCYVDFMKDCLTLAENDLAREMAARKGDKATV